MTCTCVPGTRCPNCARIRRASVRMFTVRFPESQLRHPVEYANARTSINDCRTALCIAMGYPLDQIDASTGHAPVK